MGPAPVPAAPHFETSSQLVQVTKGHDFWVLSEFCLLWTMLCLSDEQ